MDQQTVVAGASGDLGTRIAAALVDRGAAVRTLVRPTTDPAARERLAQAGATPVEVDPTDLAALTAACQGAGCVVSAVSGLRDVVVDAQSVLLDAAVAAGVPRFVPSDCSSDFTTTKPGHNRNFDLRREFAGRADRASIRVTSVLNGAFLDMLGAEMPILQPRIHRVLHWDDADQPLDFTTRADTAAYVAAAALDPDAPRYLRIAGATISARGLAEVASEVSGTRYRTLRAGGVRSLSALTAVARTLAPTKPEPVFPAWQGMAYMVDMFSGDAQLEPLDVDRYPGMTWTGARKRLGEVLAPTIPTA